jgi:biopolymer transport protein ExbD
MAENPQTTPGAVRTPRPLIRIDMTPMVDLAFLLLTFFILTTSLLRPGALQLLMPPPGARGTPGHALTILATPQGIFHYTGTLGPSDPPLSAMDMRGLRKVLLAHNRHTADTLALLDEALTAKRISPLAFDTLRERAIRGPLAGLCAVHVAPEVNYATIIALMDELDICGVGRYSITEGLLPDEEQAIVQAH